MVDLARCRDNQAAGPIVPPPVMHDLPPGQGDHRGCRSDDRAAEPRLAEDLGRDRLSRELGRIIGVHGDLVQDHRPLGVHILRRDQRVSDHVGEHVEGELGVTVQHASVEAGVLLGRVRVELAAYGLDRGRDLLRGAIRGSLEKQVFQEVGGAMQARRLVPRADRDEDAQGVGAGGPDVLSDDLEAVSQHRTADGAIQLRKAPSSTAARNGGHRR